MKRIPWFVGALLVAAACQPDRQPETATGELAEAARTDPGYQTGEPAQPVRVPDVGDDMTITGQLAGAPGSGASGDFTLTPRNGATLISVRVSGVRPETGVRIGLHSGRCDAPGAVVPGTDRGFRVEGTGILSESWEAPLAIERILDGRHALVIQSEHGGVSPAAAPPLACMELPEHRADR